MAGSAEAEKDGSGKHTGRAGGREHIGERDVIGEHRAGGRDRKMRRRRSGRPARGRIADMEPDYSDTVKNPRIGKVMRLEEEVQRQRRSRKLRSRRIRQEQEY